VNFIRLIRAAFKSIFRNRLRSILTSLGIIIGVSAVIIMVGIGEGSQAVIEENINSLGTNLLIVFPGSSNTAGVRGGAGSNNRFTFDDVEKIKKESSLLDGASPVVRAGGQVVGGTGNWSTTIYGVTPDYFKIRSWQVQYGDFFTDKDIAGSRKVVLLGKTVADQLFPGQDPTGQTIRVRNTPVTVIGVLKAKGQSGMGQDQDDVILAPSTTVLYRLKGGQWIDMINASGVSAARLPEATEELRQILRAAHKLQPGEDDDFTIRSQAELSEAMTATSETLTLLLASIAAVSLVVGGIGIMNIMLVSVTERTREIGIRLSVGARESDILIQFLTEAVVLSVSGGIIGITLSAIVVAGLNKWSDLQPIITPEIVAISFLFSAVVGVFFGFYPAWKAAALDPIDALRHE
jgi:putative ABC transport system permease protein